MSLHPLWPVGWLILPAAALALSIASLWWRPASRALWVRRIAASALALLIVLGPSVREERPSVVQASAEVYIVVDLTGSMGALDFEGERQRLDGVRHDIDQLLEAFPSARYSVIGWNSVSTVQLPLTTDANAVRSWARSAHQESTRYSTGSQIDRPLGEIQRTLTAAAQARPQDLRLLFFMSDGENTDGDRSSSSAPLESFEPLAALVDGGAVLGYGTTQGGQMRQFGVDVTEDPAPFIEAPDGTPAVSHYDEGSLRLIAEQVGVPYLHRLSTDDALARIGDDIDVERTLADGRNVIDSYRPIVWPLAAALVLLLSWDLLGLARLVRTPIGGAS